jgi:hypothetical protein
MLCVLGRNLTFSFLVKAGHVLMGYGEMLLTPNLSSPLSLMSTGYEQHEPEQLSQHPSYLSPLWQF